MKRLFAISVLMTLTIALHAVTTFINYQLKDSYGDGWNGASISIVDQTAGGETFLTLSDGYETSGSFTVVSGHTYTIQWKSGSYDYECSFKLTDARGNQILSHNEGSPIANGQLLEYTAPFKGDVNGDGEVAVNDVMEIVKTIIHGASPIQATEEITYMLLDSYGDGWNGASIGVFDEETHEEVARLTIEDGDSYSGTLTLRPEHEYDFVWFSGSYDNECSFIFYDSDGNVIFEYHPDNGGGDEPQSVKKPSPAKWGWSATPVMTSNKWKMNERRKMDDFDPEEDGLYDQKSLFVYQASSTTPRLHPADINENNEVDVNDVMEVVKIILMGYPVPDIEVSSEAIDMLVYSKVTVDITSGGGNYEVTSSEPTKLSAFLSNFSISLYSKHLGSYVVTVKDMDSGKTKDIHVTVKEAQPSCPNDHHPHIIDLGLPSGTKWACCNVGASSPEDYGGYYAWGETETKDDYSWSTYTHCDGTEGTCHDFGTSISGTQYDVAHVKWGNNWYMPSYDQAREIFFNTSYTVTKMNGVMGMLFTGSNGNSVFIPCGGWLEGTEHKAKPDYYDKPEYADNFVGFCWEGTSFAEDANKAYYYNFGNLGNSLMMYSYFNGVNRYLGYNVRAVNTAPPLSISTNNVVISDYGDVTVEITSGSGNYTVESSNTSVATATVSSNIITISSLGGGDTCTITVTDTQSGKKVSITVTVTIRSLCPDDHHPHVIDLGLPSGTKWACCNVDDDPSKQSPTNFGGHFAWGETEEKDNYSYEESELDNVLDIQGTEHDVAHMRWGSNWVMPNTFNELFDNCTQTKATINGVEGFVLTGPSGNSIFLPNAGSYDEDGSYNPNIGKYWESDGIPTMPGVACCAWLFSDEASLGDWWKYSGCSVRPVLAPGSDTSGETAIMMERKYLVDTKNDYYASSFYNAERFSYQSFTINLDNGVSIRIRYDNGYYWDGSYSNSHLGVFIEVSKDDQSEIWYVTPLVKNEWISEKLIISDNGIVGYYKNGQAMGTHAFGLLQLEGAKTMTIDVDPFGWWYTHLHYMDDLVVSTPSATLTDDFNDGVINTSIWETPVNPDGVREEDGIMKTEQLRTDQDFHLRSKSITLSNNGETEYNLTCPDDNHPHMIDLGLPSGTKWACCNVGADKPEEYGDFYAWGETHTKDFYAENTYDYYRNGNIEDCVNIGSDISGTSYDAAHYQWGGSWVMPTYDQQKELVDNCTMVYMPLNGVNGGMFIGPNGNKIFLPAAGDRYDVDYYSPGYEGVYWSSTLSNPDDDYMKYFPWVLYVYPSGPELNENSRHVGRSVRPVSK